MKAILAGATGLIGNLLARQLPPEGLTTVGRRADPSLDPRIAQEVVDVADWPAIVEKARAEVAFCTLGTTIRVAGSQAAFRAIDREAVIAFAKAAKAGGARQILLVSSVGANATSNNFYLRTKGEAEAGVSALGFERVDIFRPGLLRGDRSGTARPGEGIAIAVSPFTDLLTPPFLDRYRSIEALTVAKAMAALAGNGEAGAFIHHNRDMLREAARIG